MFHSRHPPLRWTFVAILLLSCSPACQRQPESRPPPAAEKPRVESDLSRTTLSPEHCRSLGLLSQAITIRPVNPTLALSGWIVPRQGNERILTASVAGYVQPAPGEEGFPIEGSVVSPGRQVMQLEPVPSPLEQVQLAAIKFGAIAEESKARSSLAVAQSQLRLLEELQSRELSVKQRVEEARERVLHARADLQAAASKLAMFLAQRDPEREPLLDGVRTLLLGSASSCTTWPGWTASMASLAGGLAELSAPLGREDEVRLRPRPLSVPRQGTVLKVHVSPGQYVPEGTPLLTIADLTQPWIRVPVPEEELARVDRQAEVTGHVAASSSGAGTLAGRRKRLEAERFQAVPLDLVPQVDPLRHTADLLYMLKPSTDSPRGLLAKDQLVTIFLPLAEQRPEAIVPASALLFDAHGGTWVYLERTAEGAREHRYERRRVELGPTVEEGTIVWSKPAFRPDDRVVVQGTAALFSCEFFKPPLGKQAVEDDDD
jgi:multidrug efflux pump subunit AcrA (membrane-fusion protein)